MERCFQLIRSARLPLPLNAEERRSLYTRAHDFGITHRKLAREFGVEESDVQAAFIAEVDARIDAAERRGFACGRRSLLTPPPTTALRRAA